MSYSLTTHISESPEKVFNAITTHIQDWWGYTDSSVSSLGDEFTTSFDKTFWKFKIIELEPDRKIVWNCTDARHIHSGYDGIEKEWIGTSVEWILEPISDRKMVLHFKHNGLVPELNCYEICFPAWEMFVTKSLKSFVETGKGIPSLS